ncbi:MULTISPECIES: ABC transporter permease subunit [unclassified Mesorhizobium]|uniref:ABC transporter permease n=2 Tax=unclassified Mesorhizobium TaxID=325217 RepID=UPI0003CE3AC2|nr:MULTISPECIES: ABC transporter permease subunit [unclassified Mesorhizobium]ESY20165.1 amino acid ABC transporter permease [Mesorhizobium sp. LNJC395A00]WJI76733.1 ABC transporter permease subunit [Mesorhizobium sp. C395A]
MNLFLPDFAPQLLAGFAVTLKIVAISALLGFLAAIPLTLALLSGRASIRFIASSYLLFFRGTPLLAQLFLVYYGSGQFRAALEGVGLWWLFADPFFCTILTFSLNTAAYQAQIYRGAINLVARGQTEAAQTLGLSRYNTFVDILIPQAMVVAVRPLGNELVLLVKASAVASIVAVYDLMGAARLVYARSFELSPYLWAGLIYICCVEVLRLSWNVLDRRFRRHLPNSH